MRRVLASALVASSFLAPPVLAQQVHVVDRDGGAGVDFTSLSTAVSAAAEGDILLVRDSALSYGPLTVTAKSLTILAEPQVPGGRPSLVTALVEDLAPAQTVVLRGFAVEPAQLTLQPALWVDACDGAVFVEDVIVQPGTSFGTAPLAYVYDSPRVVLNRCVLEAPSAEASLTAGPALRVEAASVAAYDCVLTGTHGRPANVSPFSGIPVSAVGGSVGVHFVSGALLLAGSAVSGGNGGDGFVGAGGCQLSHNGGNGVVVGGALTLLDSTVAGGSAGANAAGCPPAGSDGVPFQILGGGSITTIADVLRRFEVSVPIHEGTSAQNTIEGVPGELVVLLVSFAADGAFFPGLGGSLCGTAPFLAVVLGAVPAGGVLSFQVPVAVGSLPAAIDGVNVYEQVLVAGAQGFGLLGSPTVVTIVR